MRRPHRSGPGHAGIVSRAAVMKRLGARVHQILAYGVVVVFFFRAENSNSVQKTTIITDV